MRKIAGAAERNLYICDPQIPLLLDGIRKPAHITHTSRTPTDQSFGSLQLRFESTSHIVTRMSTPTELSQAGSKHVTNFEKEELVHLEHGNETVAEELPPHYFRSMNFIGTMVAAGGSYGSVSIFQTHSID